MKFRNVSGSNRTVPELGDVYVEAGATVEATGEIAERMSEQPVNWRRVDKPKAKKPAAPKAPPKKSTADDTTDITPDGGEG